MGGIGTASGVKKISWGDVGEGAKSFDPRFSW